MKNIDLAGSKFEADDITKYKYLNPIWGILENTPEDMKITSQELWEQSELNPKIGNPLLHEMTVEWMNKIINNIWALARNNEQVVHTWLFDKCMLLMTRVDTGGVTKIPNNFVFNKWKKLWREKRGL